MRAKTRVILEQCIEDGIECGFTRAHKHTDNPSPETIAVAIEHAIWLEIDERFEFDDQCGKPEGNIRVSPWGESNT